jgi:hypothetical protein
MFTIRQSGASSYWMATKTQLTINSFVADTNADPKPFVWTADPKRVLAVICH